MEPAVRPKLAVATGGDDFDRLKTLLFRPESQRLEQIENEVSALDGRVGTRDRLETATAEVLVEALKRAEVAQHRELSQAIAPVVVAAIRNEIKNSRDMMVEALYPITGRLVMAGIAVAMAELTASINARMDSLLSVKSLQLRWTAWRTGRPFGELAIAQAQRGRLVRLLYLERGSGVLLGQWQARDIPAERADLISGMIAALTEFARNAMGESGGDLRTLDMGGAKIYLRTSARMIVAAEYAGVLQPGQERALEAGFLALLESGHSGGAPDAALHDLARTLSAPPDEAPAARRGLSPVAIAGLLLLAGLVWASAVSVLRWRRENRVAAALHAVVAARPELAAYPVAADVRHGASAVQLHGLVPGLAGQAALEAALRVAAEPYALQSTHAIVATRQDAETMQSAQRGLDARLAQLGVDLETARDALARDAAATNGALARQLAGMDGRIAQLGLDLKTARDGLASETEAANGALARQLAGMDGRVARLGADLETARDGLAREAEAAKSAQGLLLENMDARWSAALETRAAAFAGELGIARSAQRQSFADVDARLTGLRSELTEQTRAGLAALAGRAGAQAEAERRRADATAGQIANLAAGLKGTQSALAGDIASARGDLAAVQSRIDAPLARMAEELRGFAVFFQDTDTIVDEAAVRARLARIAKVAAAAGGIRVVGHSDESGTPARNRLVSRARAEKVAALLVEAGLDRQRIVIVSQADASPLADKADGNALRNRRVVLEALKAGELPPAAATPDNPQ